MRDVSTITGHTYQTYGKWYRSVCLVSHWATAFNGNAKYYEAGKYYEYFRYGPGASSEEVPPEGHVRRNPQTTTSSYVASARGRGDLVLSDGFTPTDYRGYELSFTPPRSTGSSPWETYRSNDKWLWQRKYDTVGTFVPTSFTLADIYGVGDSFEPLVPKYITAKADSNLLEQVRDQKLDLAVSAAEIGESFHLISRTLMLAYKVLRAIKRGRPSEVQSLLGKKRWGDLLKIYGDVVLAYQLGWKPLISELWSLFEVMRDGMQSPAGHFTRYGKTVQELNHLKFASGAYVSGTKTISVTSQATYSVFPSAVRTLNQLGLLNPLSVAWELVPLSFVTDWFIGYGTLIGNLTSTIGLDFLHGFRTYHLSSDIGMYTYGSNTTPGSAVASSFVRERMYSFPPPRLTYGSGVSSGSRALTASGLIAVLASSR